MTKNAVKLENLKLAKKQAADLNGAREAAIDATHAAALATYNKLIAVAKEYFDSISAPCEDGFPEDGEPQWDANEAAYAKLVAARTAYHAACDAHAETIFNNFDFEVAIEAGTPVADAIEAEKTTYAAMVKAARKVVKLGLLAPSSRTTHHAPRATNPPWHTACPGPLDAESDD